jgi:phenylacetate-CoA ligase
MELSLPESAAKVAETIRTHDVEVLVACPSILFDIADTLGPNGIPTMKGIVTFGEVRTPADAAAIEEAYGVRPMDFYGTSEVHVVSWECQSGVGYHIDADSILLEVVDDSGRPAAPGEPGWVVVTALWNTAAPIVRYRVEDIATLIRDPCRCGITLPLMGMVEGRTLDWIITADGRRVSPFRLVPVTLLGDEWSPHVRRSRVIQRAADDFLVEVEWRAGRREDLVARFGPALEWVLGSPVRLECRDVDEIRVGPSEKFRQVVSLVSRSQAGNRPGSDGAGP